jgi:hypothetical protein
MTCLLNCCCLMAWWSGQWELANLDLHWPEAV